VLAAVLFIKRIAETTQITKVDEATETEGAHDSVIGKDVPEGVLVFRLFGAFTFGAADKLETAFKRVGAKQPKVIVLRMRQVLAIDATGLNALEDLYKRIRSKHQHLVLSAPHSQPLFTMEKAGLLEVIGRENICATFDDALARARQLL
jgi:SulP family sulfate permease